MYVGIAHISRKLLPYLLLLGLFVGLFFLIFTTPTHATAGINQQINFQGRLLNTAGATVPDGYYNVQFKIYQDGDGLSAGDTTGSPAGTLKWTESYLNANSQGVVVINGFMSVQLGSITPFGTSIDWNQNTLWLSMNIGSTNTSCTPFTSCTPDGEMLPMKRLSSTPYALNSGLLGGLTSAQFLQIAQGVQTDSSVGVNSIYLNKTSTGNFIGFQSSGVDVFTLTNAGDITYGANANHTLSVATAAASVAGKSLTLSAGAGGTGAGTVAGGDLILQGGAAGGTNSTGGNVSINAGAASGSGAAGTISIGTSQASTVQIGSTTLSTGTQTIGIGNNNTSGGTTNVTIGSGASATGGTTAVQSKGDTTFTTNGTARATLSGSGNTLYVGNANTSGQAATANAFTIQGTASTGASVQGGSLTIQSGAATSGNANGGNLNLTGGAGIGTGAAGIVVINTPTYQTAASDSSCFPSGAPASSTCTFTAASVNGSSALIAGFTTTGLNANLPDPTNTTAGRVIYITASLTSADFTLRANIGAGTGIEQNIAMRKNTTATMIWNGADWTAAGASSSTTLQAAYDNTLQSAGGAELVVSATAATNGLTIRDSSTAPVNGTLLSVQTASAASLISINGNVTEYASNGGAETAGVSSSTFPANTWTAAPVSATISRDATTAEIATGQGSVSVATSTTALSGVKNILSTSLTPNQHYNVSFTTRLSSGTFTNMEVYYSNQGTNSSVLCTSGQAVKTSVWTKVNCTFTASASGITSSNAIIIRQTGSGTARTFFVDNLSVTIAADYNYATDGGVDDVGNFTTNWVSAGAGTVVMTQNTTDGQAASSSAQAAISTNTALAGMRNKLSINPLTSTLYRISTYAKLSSGSFTDFTVRYSPDNGSTFVNCVDYNTQTVTTTGWTQITCYIKTVATAVTNPYVYFVQNAAPGGARTFLVDTFSMTLASNSTPNVQIGGGVNGGPTTLFTLDKGASAPIAANNDALLGSMYYDTTLGKLQCYEADGWGACGSSPDNVITISPEFTNAVLHGTGVGTMTSDICSDTLNINDGSSGQDTICGANETYNFYKWTSPQATAQTYSLYVTYQLPGTFNSFASGQTSIMGRTDSTNATVQYQIYRNNPAVGLVACGSLVSVSTGVASSWQTGTASGAADPSTCGFAASDSIVFKINVISSVNANAYVGNLNFIFSNK